ncbi:sugar phosphate isomerase/epimerase family protein [Dyadobacter tibetensis]|uniref:sugar phosphate isomerase/epimerase family protein n=1 Tax=Dyadobacter tibetensis TaxID=1211851 RepID=UPI000471C3C4|nr:sugar phosphate isomerase/epimerase family protein [Dyadobacter tibetensis]
MESNQMNRRTFLESVSGAATYMASLPLLASLPTSKINAPFQIPLGVFAAYRHAEYLRGLGCTYIEEAVGRFLVPGPNDPDFTMNKAQLENLKFPIWSYVVLLPAEMKTVGSDLKHEEALLRTELALKRAKECGSSYIVFGSGGARNIPEGFDRATALRQHIALCRRMAPLAEKYGVTIAIEPLNKGETNFINSLAEGVEIVKAVNSPKVKLLCDIYHMLVEEEPASEIIRFGQHIVHCHIAEKEARTPPGEKGDNFRPYLSALKQIGYQGGLSIECFHYDNFDSQIRKGILELQKQISEV